MKNPNRLFNGHVNYIKDMMDSDGLIDKLEEALAIDKRVHEGQEEFYAEEIYYVDDPDVAIKREAADNDLARGQKHIDLLTSIKATLLKVRDNDEISRTELDTLIKNEWMIQVCAKNNAAKLLAIIHEYSNIKEEISPVVSTQNT
ncbi:MAG: hypothetical protein A3F18_05930 [Legionellales bacterium RIFCSPHIGHO2_12_FULL_37_14]|nr:MAG: hypothetical protein A3F18_05930 [Legionellales bacterium RIFCSPHIGHO2_12_FULL_37_14]